MSRILRCGLVLLLLLPLFAIGQSLRNKLLILGIDGCRPDALLESDAPHLRNLAEQGTYSWDALARPPTKSGPSWSSIMTGAWNDKHGVTDNNFTNARYDAYPHFYKRLKDFYPEARTASIVYWAGINSGIPNHADFVMNAANDDLAADTVISFLEKDDYDAIFVQFGEIDAAGHNGGFSPENSGYISAIEKVDSLVGEVMDALHHRPGYSDENWMTIALADHGGNGGHHGGSTFEEMRVFVIVAGDSIPKEEVPDEWQTREVSAPGAAFSLNGKDNFMTVRDSSLYQFGSDQDFTVEFCIRTSGWSGNPVVISNQDLRNETNPGFSILQWDEGAWRVTVADGSKRKRMTGPVIYDNLWHHLTAVFHRKGNLTIYQDGIKIGALDISTLGDIDSQLGLVLGQDALLNQGTFAKGSLCEVRIWDTVLTGAVIQDWQFRTVTADHPEFDHLIGYWKMDEGENSTMADLSKSQNHGLMHGSAHEWIEPTEQIHVLDFEASLAVKTVDVAVTALNHFKIPIDTAWNLDGRVIAEKTEPSSQTAWTEQNHPDFYLDQNYPNPFNSETLIPYQIWKSSAIRLSIFNLQGREIKVLFEGVRSEGRYAARWDGENKGDLPVSSGIYVVSLKSEDFTVSAKMLFIK